MRIRLMKEATINAKQAGERGISAKSVKKVTEVSPKISTTNYSYYLGDLADVPIEVQRLSWVVDRRGTTIKTERSGSADINGKEQGVEKCRAMEPRCRFQIRARHTVEFSYPDCETATWLDVKVPEGWKGQAAQGRFRCNISKED